MDVDDLVIEIAGYPIRGTMLVADGAGQVQRLDRLLSIDGTPVLGDYEIETVRTQARADPNHVPAVKSFEFERAGETFYVEGASLFCSSDRKI